MKEVEKLKAEQDKKKEEEKKDGDIEVYDEPDVDSKENVNDVIKTKKQIDKDSKEPIYQIKYSNNFELNKFFYNPQGFEETPKIDYKKIIIEINTPLMEGISDAELEIDTKKLKFKYKDIYLLNLDLPIEINRDSTKAKFEKAKKILTLSADIVHKKQQIPEKKIDENMEIINEEEEKRKEEEKKKKEEEERIKKEIKKEMEEKTKKEEEEKKKKEEELRIKKEKELKEKKEKERIEKEKKEKMEKERIEKEQLEKNKEETVFIRGKKDNNDNSLIKNKNELKEIKYKEDNEIIPKQSKKLIEEIIPEEKEEEKKDDYEEIKEDEINTSIPMKKQLEIFRKRREEVKKGENDKNKKVTKIKEVKKEIEKKEEKEENKKHDEDDIVVKPSNTQINTQNNSKEDTRTPTCFLSFSNDWIYEID